MEIVDILNLLFEWPWKAGKATVCNLYRQKSGSTQRNGVLYKMPINIQDTACNVIGTLDLNQGLKSLRINNLNPVYFF